MGLGWEKLGELVPQLAVVSRGSPYLITFLKRYAKMGVMGKFAPNVTNYRSFVNFPASLSYSIYKSVEGPPLCVDMDLIFEKLPGT